MILIIGLVTTLSCAYFMYEAGTWYPIVLERNSESLLYTYCIYVALIAVGFCIGTILMVIGAS